MTADYAHPMPPFEALPEPVAAPKPKAAKAKHEIIERLIASNSSGTYYPLTVATKGALNATATVTVKHTTKHSTLVCLTCNSADSCEHSAAVRRYLDRRAAA